MMLKHFVLLLTLFLGQIAMAQPAANLITNGDFEAAAPINPPSGWAMWGADGWKIPANHSRDETVVHSGKASLRIFRPANSGGYIVTAPAQAIRPQAGQRYTASFWARADKVGTARFSITAYESIAPFKDAPSPGSWHVPVTPEWKRYEYSFDEGFDFYAERSQYLMLSFNASSKNEVEQTLWIDDVVVTATPSPLKGRLLDEKTLDVPPLLHRLQPGTTLDVTIDNANVVRPATRMAGGISFHRLAGFTGQPFSKSGEYTLDPRLETAIRELRLPMTRIYALSAEQFNIEAALDRAHELVQRIGVAETDTILELETQGANTKITPEVWASAVRYSKIKGYKFQYWEIGNEVYSSLWNGGGDAFATPQDYVTHIKAVSAAIRAVDPQAKIGLSFAPHNQKWGNAVLMQAAGAYDFVCGHYYVHGDVTNRSFEEIVLAENYRTLNRILQVNALLQAYNSGRDVYQLDTEWGLHGANPQGGASDYVSRNANIYGTLHRAVRLIYYGREELLRGASSWQMLSGVQAPGFGILSQQAPDKRFMLYWLYYYFNRHLGSEVLSINGTTPFYTAKDIQGSGPSAPLLATRSADGKQIYIVMANGSWQNATPSRIRLPNTKVNGVTGTILSSSDAEAHPVLEKIEDFVQPFTAQHTNNELNFTLPPHSVVFLTLDVG